MKKAYIIILWLLAAPVIGRADSPPENLEVDIQPSSLLDLSLDKPSRITSERAQLMRDLALGEQIAGLDAQDQMIIKNQSMGLARRKLWQQIKGFAPEALVFYTAIGAVMVRKAYTDQLISGRKDPLWLENLSHEITSPLGVFSFFCFLIASGQTNYWLSQSLRPWSKQLAAQKRFQTIHTKRWSRKVKSARAGGRPLPKAPWNMYKVSRFGFRQTAGLINQSGLAAGIIASNIVTEIGMLSGNPAIHYCANYLLPESFSNEEDKLSPHNATLVCDDAFSELTATVKSWGPDILSIVTASFINHGLTQGLFTIKKAGEGGVRFLKNVTIRYSSSAKLLLSGLAGLIPGPGRISRAASIAGHWTFRLFNLYAFMEIAELTNHHLFHGWTESIKANSLAESITHHLDHLKQPHQETGLNCPPAENPDTAECAYHLKVRSAVQTSGDFRRWRQFQAMPIQAARQGWFNYVSRTLAYFDTAYLVYKNLFLSRSAPTPFNQTYYFGALSPAAGFPTDPAQPLPQNITLAFQTMAKKINSYKMLPPPQKPLTLKKLISSAWDNGSDSPPAQPPVNITASIADSHFIKNNIMLRHKRIVRPLHAAGGWFVNQPAPDSILLTEETQQLTVLYRMFLASSNQVSLEPYYDNWSEELSLAKAKVFKDSARRLKSQCNQAGEFIKTINQLRKENPQSFEAIEAQTAEFVSVQKAMIKKCLKLKTGRALGGDSNSQLLTWESAQEVMNKYYQDHPDQWNQRAEKLLRQKVLAAGVQLLQVITDLKVKTEAQNIDRPPLSENEKLQISQLKKQGFPDEVIAAVQTLRPDNIFAQLLQEIYQEAPQTSGYVSLKPASPGERITAQLNQHNKAKEDYFQSTYHPTRLGGLPTDQLMDFITASFLCGPNLQTNNSHKEEIEAVQKIAAGELLLEEAFPNKNMGAVISQWPVFDRSITGTPFYFKPPGIPTNPSLNNNWQKDLQKLCKSGMKAADNPYADIQHKALTVGGRTYTRLIDLALDHASQSPFETEEEFDAWWDTQVKPYQQVFALAADREYKRLMSVFFMPLLFQNDTTAAGAGVTSGSSGLLKLAQAEGLFHIESKNLANSHLDKTNVSFHFAKGIFHNIHQEITYWADHIISLSEGSAGGSAEGFAAGFERHQTAKSLITRFVHLFETPIEPWETKLDAEWSDVLTSFFTLRPQQLTDQSQREYKSWVRTFLSEEQRDISYLTRSQNICSLEAVETADNKLQEAYLLLHVAACLLNVNLAVLEERQQASQVILNKEGRLSQKEFTWANDQKIGFFYEGDKQTDHSQIINYAFMALKNLMIEAGGYMDMVYSVSNAPDTARAVQAPHNLFVQ